MELQIIKACMREGHPLPQKIANAPELRLGLELYFGAFLDLCNSRSGMGDGPIPWTIVAEYARAYGFDEVQSEDLHYYVTAMDGVYMKWVRSKNASTTSTASKPKRK